MPDKSINLVEHINDALRESKFPFPNNGYFAPKSALSVITKPSITRTIWSHSKSFETLVESDRELVEFISAKAQEIFAIGIYLDSENLKKMMRLFMTHNKTDGSLPISDAELEKIWPEVNHRGRRRAFKDAQHLFRPQSFPRRDRFSVIYLQPNIVLPIFESELKSQGQFGIVYRVTLHEEFLDSHDPIRKVRRTTLSAISRIALLHSLVKVERLLKSVWNLSSTGNGDNYLMTNPLRHEAWLPSRSSENPLRMRRQSEAGRGRSRLCRGFAGFGSRMWWTSPQ